MYHHNHYAQAPAGALPAESGAQPVAPLQARAPQSDHLPQYVEELLQKLLGLRELRLRRPEVEAEYQRRLEALRGAASRAEWERLSDEAFTALQQLQELDRTAALIDENLQQLRQYLIA